MKKAPAWSLNVARAALIAAACAGALGLAAAQTALTPVAPDPQQASLLDRVDQLQADLQKATAENEKLEHDLAASQAEVARLQKIVDASSPAPAASSSPPSATATGSLDAQIAEPAPKPAPPADPQTAYNQAYALVTQGDYAGAETAFRGFMGAYPKDALAIPARYWLGQSLLAQNKNADAAEQFLGIVKSSPKSAKAPDAYLSLGSAFKQMGQSAQACQVFRDVPVKFPNASAAVKTKAAQRAKTCPA